MPACFNVLYLTITQRFGARRSSECTETSFFTRWEDHRPAKPVFVDTDAKSHPYFPGLVLPYGQKLTLGILATIILDVVPFRAHAPFPELLPFYKFILEVVFCGCSAPPTILPRWSQLCQNGGLSGKSRVGGRWQSCCFWSKIPWLKRKSETDRCRDATASSFVIKVRGEVFAHIHAVVVKRHSSMRNCLACQDEFIVNNLLNVTENDEHALDLALHLSRLFRSALNRTCHSNIRVRFMLSFPNACLFRKFAPI
jgi:hypothetical protein